MLPKIKSPYFITIKINRYLVITLVIMLIFVSCCKEVVIVFKENLFIKTVVVDPGHGGIDGGTHDNNGLLEKNINLDVALKLKKILEKENVKIIMTRTSDVSLEDKSDLNSSRYKKDLDARKDIINSSNADVFVSIHVNANPRQLHTRGTIVFYHPKSCKGKELAKTINDSIETTIFKNYLQDDSLKGEVLPQNYFILRETHVPGVLVEIGFLTNPEDKKLLQDEEYKERIAKAIGYGIMKYLGQVPTDV
ncbi:MAG: N-acetylmuramoyl-L-alanine amidase [Clostridia bacterium]|nr:N-acetylmuramoyl-L-alanine amidase [Clostridia bacterium]